MTFEDLHVGMSAHSTRVVTDEMIHAFADATGDRNPLHLDEVAAARTQFGGRIAHGMLSAGFISATLAHQLPGAGIIYVSQTLRFRRPVRIGDAITVTVTVASLVPEKRRVRLTTVCINDAGDEVVTGEAEVLVPQ